MGKRTNLASRSLPSYTKGEEIFNMVTHIVGGAMGVLGLVYLIILSALKKDSWGIVGSAIYGSSLIALYTMSSVYHGLKESTAKKVMQVMDHCTIFFLIAGTYTPILLSAIRRVSPAWAWSIFGIVWGFAVLGIVLNAIDLRRYAKFSMICYIGMGWCIILAGKVALRAIPFNGFAYLLFGGIAYTIGAVFYILGVKHKYIHSVFHIFVVLGSLLQFLSIAGYII